MHVKLIVTDVLFGYQNGNRNYDDLNRLILIAKLCILVSLPETSHLVWYIWSSYLAQFDQFAGYQAYIKVNNGQMSAIFEFDKVEIFQSNPTLNCTFCFIVMV